jgi:hypothetical protein
MTKNWILIISLSTGSLAFAQGANENNPSDVPSQQPSGPAGGPADVRSGGDSEGRVDIQNKADQANMQIDINTAGLLQLKTLPGIDDATAQKIVASRPYRSPDDLVKKGVLTEQKFEMLRSRLTVKPMMNK